MSTRTHFTLALACGLLTLSMPTVLAAAEPPPSLKVLHCFGDHGDGHGPYAGLVQAASGNLYGTTVSGGAYKQGVIFRVAPDGGETVLHSFQYGDDGGVSPGSALIIDSQGNLLGTAASGGSKACTGGCGTVFKLTPDGQLIVLHSFQGGETDGGNPQAALLAGAKGNLFGTTAAGGSTKCSLLGCGTVFKIAPDGTESVLHFFKGAPRDGRGPYAALIADEHGNLYGTTGGGGTHDKGTVYKIAPDGSETVLHSFAESPRHGNGPIGALIRDSAGNLYGTASGGSTKHCYSGCGVVFRIAPDGTETVLHYFEGRDGADPLSGLTFDSRGNLYGTTFSGGTKACLKLCGTIFGMSPEGQMLVRFNFEGGKLGSNPWAGLVMDSAGHFYGTTINDGRNRVRGTVFEFTP